MLFRSGSDLGPLFTTIIANQFARLRAGDRFFYLNESWNTDELRILSQGNSLAKIIETNTGITNLQADVFRFTASITGSVILQGGARAVAHSAAQGLSGIAVQLEDASGNVLRTTVTDRSGRYQFNQLSGIGGTGDYSVRLILPSGLIQSSRNPSAISINRGGIAVKGVDFVLAHGGAA